MDNFYIGLDGLGSYVCLAGWTGVGWINFYMGLDFFGCQKWRKWPKNGYFWPQFGSSFVKFAGFSCLLAFVSLITAQTLPFIT